MSDPIRRHLSEVEREWPAEAQQLSAMTPPAEESVHSDGSADRLKKHLRVVAQHALDQGSTIEDLHAQLASEKRRADVGWSACFICALLFLAALIYIGMKWWPVWAERAGS